MIEHPVFQKYVTGAAWRVAITGIALADDQGLVAVVLDITVDAKVLHENDLRLDSGKADERVFKPPSSALCYGPAVITKEI